MPRSADLATVLEMPDVELIINLTIPAVHASVALQAIRSGKHVYGEKPFALSIEEGQTIIAAAAEHKVHLGNAPDTFLGGLADGTPGDRGRPHWNSDLGKGHIWLSRPGRLASKSRVSFPKGGGPLLDMGPYYLTALVQLFGPVKTVSGFGRRAQKADDRQRTTRRRDLRGHRGYADLGVARVCLRADRHCQIQL